MIWVVFAHSDLKTGIPVIDFIKLIGYGGVDLFLLLSGIGIFFSLKKNFNTLLFYKKRVLRIFPYYIPIVLLTSIYLVVFHNSDIASIFYNLTTLSFWLNTSKTIGTYGFDWYIPSLLLFYAISPLYIKSFKKRPYIATLIVSLIGIFLSLLISDTKLSYLLIFTTRIPIYFIGILVGYLIDKKKKIGYKMILLFLVMFFVGIIGMYLIKRAFLLENAYILWAYGLWWYPFMLITFPALMILSFILSIFKNYSYPVLSFIGEYTLVIYLLHERLLLIAKDYPFTDSIVILNFVVIAVTLFIGYFFQNTVSKLLDKK